MEKLCEYRFGLALCGPFALIRLVPYSFMWCENRSKVIQRYWATCDINAWIYLKTGWSIHKIIILTILLFYFCFRYFNRKRNIGKLYDVFSIVIITKTLKIQQCQKILEDSSVFELYQYACLYKNCRPTKIDNHMLLSYCDNWSTWKTISVMLTSINIYTK